mgnify:CR=1 FL=1
MPTNTRTHFRRRRQEVGTYNPIETKKTKNRLVKVNRGALKGIHISLPSISDNIDNALKNEQLNKDNIYSFKFK